MKKVLPLLLLFLMAFSGCHREPVMYKMAEKPSEIAVNAEQFVKQTAKRAKHYSAEDWQIAVEQFTAMSKNCFEMQKEMSQEDLNRYDKARVEFMKVVTVSGSEDLALQIKEIYANIYNR